MIYKKLIQKENQQKDKKDGKIVKSVKRQSKLSQVFKARNNNCAKIPSILEKTALKNRRALKTRNRRNVSLDFQTRLMNYKP